MTAVRVITITADELREIIREELRAAAELRPAPEARPALAGYLSVPRAAEYADCSEETIRGWIHAGRLPRRRKGRQYLVSIADLDRVLADDPRPTPVDLARRKEEIIRSLRRG